ncbi:type II secretion system F family protein [Inquilinus sp. OTU3971]|uniref:type II secretion system F family protein n=1 Tax=Inquilinus sp. OTU3971 TaxID=3043855 RepID=UPI00313CC149
MPVFAYKAIDGSGAVVEGRAEAADEASLTAKLEATGILPLSMAPVRAQAGRSGAAGGGARTLGRRRGPKSGEITQMTRELAILVAAGQPLEQALVTLSQGTGTVGALSGQVLARVRAGTSLSTALEEQGPVFPRLYVNMVRAGESSGTLDVVLERLAELRERGEKTREMVVSAMLYPAILIVVSLSSVFLLLTFVVPQFETIFKDAGAALPTPTAVVIAIGRFCQDYGWMVGLGIVAAVIVVRRILAQPGPRLAWDRAMLRLPLIGPLVRTLATARFCRTLSTLVGNGVDLPSAIALSRDVVSNTAVSAAMETVITGVRQGRGLADPLAEIGLFPPLAVQMLRVGEETGRIDMTSAHVAEAYERKLEAAIKRLVTLVEPTLIIVLGLAVGGIVMSILLAVISINDLAF